MELTPSFFCSLAAAVYVTTCLVVAAVRWFHICRPYDNHWQYYYPGRPYLTGAWLSALTLVPYVLWPGDADAWFLARFYFLPVTLYHFTLILFSYFGSVMQWKKWLWPEVLSGVPVALVLLVAVVLAVVPGEQLGGTVLADYLLYVSGILITALCFASIAIIYVWANRFDPDDFSNPADFPVTRARKWLAMIILNLGLCWAGALLSSPAVLAVLMLVIAVFCVITLLTALHPNRNGVPEEPTVADSVKGPLSDKRREEILSAVIQVVETQGAFRYSHLTLQDVADRCGYNRTYISNVIKSRFGGFVDYVNRLRLADVDDYLSKHPDATIAEAIEEAGFGSKPAYYAFKAKLQEKK